MEELLGVGEVGVEHFLAVGLGDGRTCAIVEDDAGSMMEGFGPNRFTEGSGIDIISHFAVDQVAELGSISHVVNNHDIGDATAVQLLDDVRTDEAGATGDNNHIVRFSLKWKR